MIVLPATAGGAPQATRAAPTTAASLTESFIELGKSFETQNPGVKVFFSLAGSQQLAQQLDQDEDARVCAAAGPKYVDAAVTSKRINKDDATIFVKNRLVVIVPRRPSGRVAGIVRSS